MRIHPALSLIPTAGAIGAGVMSYNASIHIAHQQNALSNKAYGIGTNDLNFMGMQDAFIAGALLIGFAAIARATYLYSMQQKGDARKYFALGGALLAAAGLYAMTAGFFVGGIPGSKIGTFGDNPDFNQSVFSLVYTVLSCVGAAMMYTSYKMTQSNAKTVEVTQDAHDPKIGSPTLTSTSNKGAADKTGATYTGGEGGTGTKVDDKDDETKRSTTLGMGRRKRVDSGGHG